MIAFALGNISPRQAGRMTGRVRMSAGAGITYEEYAGECTTCPARLWRLDPCPALFCIRKYNKSIGVTLQSFIPDTFTCDEIQVCQAVA